MIRAFNTIAIFLLGLLAGASKSPSQIRAISIINRPSRHLRIDAALPISPLSASVFHAETREGSVCASERGRGSGEGEFNLNACLVAQNSNVLVQRKTETKEAIENKPAAEESSSTDLRTKSVKSSGLVESLNIANPCVSVDSQGASGNGTTDDRGAFQKAVDISRRNGTNAICLSKGKRYLISSTGGTIQLPSDSGLCPPLAKNCTNLPPEEKHFQAYSILFPSNFKVYGNGAEVIGPWKSDLRVGLDTPFTFICSNDTVPGSIQPVFKKAPSYTLEYGGCVNVVVQDVQFNRTFVAIFAPGLLANSVFDHLTFGTTGIEMLIHYSDRNVFTNWQGNNSYSGKVTGGWWVHRCCTGDTATDDIGNGGYNDLEVTNRYVVTQLGDPTKDAAALDNYFDTYFYKASNSRNGRALQIPPRDTYHGIFGMGLITYARYGRPSNNGILSNIVCEGLVRECIYSDARWNQATINSVAAEGMGFCHGPLLGGAPFGSSTCPDPLGFGGISPGPILFNSGQPIGSITMQSLQVPNSNYSANAGGPGIAPGTAIVTNSQQVSNQIEPGNNGVWKSGQGGGQVGVSYPSSKLQVYGVGGGKNGTSTDDGWVWQSFPPTVSDGDDTLNFMPAYNPQLLSHNYYVKIPGLSLCSKNPTSSNTQLNGCNTVPLKYVSGAGQSIVSDIGPTIRSIDNTNTSRAITVRTAAGANIFSADGTGQISMNNGKFIQSVSGDEILNSSAQAVPWRLGTLGAFDMFFAPNGKDAVHIYKSGGVTVGSGADPGQGNLTVQGGFTGTIHLGNCNLLIKGGIIVGTSGTC